MVKIHGHVSQLLGAIGVDILDKSGFNAIGFLGFVLVWRRVQ